MTNINHNAPPRELSGAYVHIVGSRDEEPGIRDLKKIRDVTAPTPASFLGIARFRLFNSVGRWTEKSGFVLSMRSPCVACYKYDFRSSSIEKENSYVPFDQFVAEKTTGFRNVKDVDIQRLGQYIKSLYLRSPILIRDGYLPGAEKLRHPEDATKLPRLSFSFEQIRPKYMEISSRQNGVSEDISTKYKVAKKFKEDGLIPPNSINQSNVASVVRMLKDFSIRYVARDKTSDLYKFFTKLGEMNENEQVTYLNRAFYESPREGKYRKYEHSDLPHNEHLLLPDLEDVIGIFVNTVSAESIHHAKTLRKNAEEFLGVTLPCYEKNENGTLSLANLSEM